MKSLSDWAFSQGVNSTVLHLYIQQAYEDVYPDVYAWFGTEFNRRNSWYRHKTGTNTLEIEVINTWRNRLIGDHQLPEKQRLVFSRINPWNGNSTLQPSGLFGPVSLFETAGS